MRRPSQSKKIRFLDLVAVRETFKAENDQDNPCPIVDFEEYFDALEKCDVSDREQVKCICSMSKTVHQLIHNPEWFESWHVFEDPRFAENISRIVPAMNAFDLPKEFSQFIIDDILASIWGFLESDESILAYPELVMSVYPDLDRESGVWRSALFALANYAAISERCRNFLIEVGLHRGAGKFYRNHSEFRDRNTALRLFTNMLSYGPIDWDDLLFREIVSSFRGDLISRSLKLRERAAGCLCHVLPVDGGLDIALFCQVPPFIRRSLRGCSQYREYYPQIFQLMCWFVSLDEYGTFIEEDVLGWVRDIMLAQGGSDHGTGMTDLFVFLAMVMPSITEYLCESGMINDIKVLLMEGKGEDKVATLLMLGQFFRNVTPGIIREIADYDVLISTAEMLESVEPDQLDEILDMILHLVSCQDLDVEATWCDGVLLEAMDDVEVDDENIRAKIQNIQSIIIEYLESTTG